MCTYSESSAVVEGACPIAATEVCRGRGFGRSCSAERGACVRRMLDTRSAYDAEKRLLIASLTSRGLPETRGFPSSVREEQPVLLIRERRRAKRERLLAVCLPET